jgi:hypothetical protein
MKPAFTNTDYNLFNKYISKSTNYFEFGSGGSTYEAYKKVNIKKIFSVESSNDWINKIISSLNTKNYQINDNNYNKRLNFFFIDFNTNIGHLGLPLPNLNDNVDFLTKIKNKSINSMNIYDDKLLNGKVIDIENESPFNCLIKVNDNKNFLVHPKVVRLKNKNIITNFNKYSDSIITLHEKINPNIDLILIDGRFRVMCALKCCKVINKNCIVLIDDFFNRKSYHVLFDYFDIIEKGERMVALKKKENAVISDEILQNFENDSR